MSAPSLHGRAALKDRGPDLPDLYETPAVAVDALLLAEQLPHRIWEPAAGRGAIVRALEAAGHEVVGTDLNDFQAQFPSGIDFLLERVAPAGAEAIVTNPPYKLANEFVAHALDLCPRVVMLRLNFLESSRQTPADSLPGATCSRTVFLFLRCTAMDGPAPPAIELRWMRA
jgi:hypothetical protein